MFCHYLDAHRAMLAMVWEHGEFYKVVKVAMNHFEIQRTEFVCKIPE